MAQVRIYERSRQALVVADDESMETLDDLARRLAAFLRCEPYVEHTPEPRLCDPGFHSVPTRTDALPATVLALTGHEVVFVDA